MCGPGPERVGAGVAERPDHGDGLGRGGEGEHVPVVLEQHERLLGQRESDGLVLRAPDHLGFAFFVGAAEGLVEEAQILLELQDSPDGVVELSAVDQPLPDQQRERPDIAPALHVHVGAGLERDPAGVESVLGDPMHRKFADRAEVADDDAPEAPFRRRTSRRRRSLATPGMPSTALNAAITQRASASTAALKGGSCCSRRARSDRSRAL